MARTRATALLLHFPFNACIKRIPVQRLKSKASFLRATLGSPCLSFSCPCYTLMGAGGMDSADAQLGDEQQDDEQQPVDQVLMAYL